MEYKNASYMKKIADKKNKEINLDSILRLIEIFAKDGFYRIQLTVSDEEKYALEKLGYNVKHTVFSKHKYWVSWDFPQFGE